MKRNTLWAHGCTALLLSACGSTPPASEPSAPGGGDAETPTPARGSVSGKLFNARGEPVVNSPVLLMHASGQVVVNTDGSGAFSFPDVAVPYDLATVTRDKSEAKVYKGLTQRVLTLLLHEDPPVPDGALHSATLEGAFSGGQPPYVGANAPVLFFRAPPGSGVSFPTSGGSATGYSRKVEWRGPTSITGSLYALQSTQDPATGLPTGFPGYGRRDNVTLTEGATVSAQDVALEAVASAPLALDVAVPTGLQLAGTGVAMMLPDQAFFSIAGQNRPSGTSFRYVVPQVAQATFILLASATEASPSGFSYSSAQKTDVVAGSTTTLSLPDVARPLAPEAAAVGVTHGTDFSWSPVAGGVYSFQLRTPPGSSPRPLSLSVFTANTHTSVPDLRAIGFSLPANTSFMWSVVFEAISPATVDALFERVPDSAAGFSELATSLGPWRLLTTAATP